MKKMTTFLGGALIAAALLLSGCQNFLTANAEAREKLRAEADYNRASSIKVSAHVENNSHGVIKKTVTGAKVGYPFQVGFNCSDDYYVKGWIVKDGDHTLSNETDYTVQEMGNGTYEITVKYSVSSIELIPECYKKPTVTFMNPKEYSDDGLDSSVRGESLNILGSQMVKVGETYLVNLKTDKGYKIDAIKIKKDGRDLTDFEGIVSFSGKKVIDGIYQEKIKFLSHEADGIEICPVAIVGEYAADDIVLGAPVIRAKSAYKGSEIWTTTTRPEIFKSFDTAKENSYPEALVSKGSWNLACYYILEQTEGLPYKKFYVEERVMKIPEDSIVTDKNNNWIDGSDVGLCFSKTNDFQRADVLNESEYLWSGEIQGIYEDPTLNGLKSNEQELALEFKLNKPGWHQWNIWAVSEDKEGNEIRSDIPVVFVSKVQNGLLPYYDYDGVKFDQDYLYSTIVRKKAGDFSEHSVAEKLVISITAGDKRKIHAIEIVQSNYVSQGVDYSRLVYQNIGTNSEGYGIFGGFNGAAPYLKWQVRTPFRGTENRIECFWIDWVGNKSKSKVYTYNIPKAFPGEIALAKASSKTGGYSTDYVTYMSKADYDSWGKTSLVDKNIMSKVGYVYYSDEKNIIVINYNVGTECSWQKLGTQIDNINLAYKCYPLNEYSIERDYNRIREIHEDYWRVKDASGNFNYPAIYKAYNDTKTTIKTPTPSGNGYWDEKIIDIGWYIPSEKILYYYMADNIRNKINEWDDSPLKPNNCYWTVTSELNTATDYVPRVVLFQSSRLTTQKNSPSNSKCTIDRTAYPVKVLTITNLGDKRYQEVTKD
ncbi:hypothetical protein [Treponema sp.]|uniref:hypothetical protein n=1 Tax=Treponema sp. TaxID=166 RepID=UPI00388F6E4D